MIRTDSIKVSVCEKVIFPIDFVNRNNNIPDSLHEPIVQLLSLHFTLAFHRPNTVPYVTQPSLSVQAIIYDSNQCID